MLPIAAGVGLGLLALIGAAVVLRRRRLRREEELAAADEVDPEYESAVQPLAAKPVSAAAVAESASTGPCADAAPGSHVEAACDGPTADNPSLSIKKRLKRAQFFDQREFLAEAGEVAPMASDAGLPESVAEPEPAPAPAPGTRIPA